MPERPAVTASEVAGRAALLSTKLHPPGPRPDFLPRPRLAERLDEALPRGLVLVCAPAGYGKTSLLASWARHSQQPVAWLSLDAGDNDPARFWRHAVAALDRVRPGITPGEAAALLQQVAAAPGGARLGAPLPESVAATLAARTEGWAAGLQLAGLSLRGRGDVDGFVAAFTGSHRYVLDYLAEEVLEHQSEQVRTFLLETSVLERLSGALCDAVTGRPGSQALLEGAERAGLFL